jgi:RNA polymerase sigma-70 factor (ECF subfamily)
MNDREFIPTRRSLLTRLKRCDDRVSWEEFFNTYSRLIYRVASRAGLTDGEAQDVVQETMIVVARKIPGFKYDPARGSFKSWLLLITRRRIEKQLKKRLPFKADQASQAHPSIRTCGSSNHGTRTETVERIADPNGFDLEAVWNAEWEKSVWDAALARVKTQVKPKQFQMFDLYVLKGWPVKDVARALGASVAHVYVNKHRIARLLKQALHASGPGPSKDRSLV